MSIKMIAAVSQNGVIGVDNSIPWNYPEDMKHFKTLTSAPTTIEGKTILPTIVMGRKTFESIGRPLPKRKNIVITSSTLEVDGIITGNDLNKVIGDSLIGESIWLIGGSSIYQEGMLNVDEIHLTLVPDWITQTTNVIRFPWINPKLFKLDYLGKLPNTDEASMLRYAIWIRK
jgi:dihydrofolate reductase